jgi:hypothetical protein
MVRSLSLSDRSAYGTSQLIRLGLERHRTYPALLRTAREEGMGALYKGTSIRK